MPLFVPDPTKMAKFCKIFAAAMGASGAVDDAISLSDSDDTETK